jgi:signal peptidase II
MPDPQETTDSGREPGPARAPLIILLSTAVLVLVLDLATKIIATAVLQPGRPVSVLGEYVRLVLVFNSGAAFGLFPGSRLAFIVFSVAAILLILLLYWRLPGHTRLQLVALGGLLGGALGNLHDRVRTGVVVDFIEIGVGRFHWPVFNVADMAVTIGVALLLLGVARRPA